MGMIRWDAQALRRELASETGPVAAALLRVGVDAVSRARRTCPVDTGRLRASITHDMGRDSIGLFIDVGSNVQYAPFVEATHPTRRGFLRRAVTEAVGRAR